MIADSPYEARFSLHSSFAAIDACLVVYKDNFDSDLHTKLVRTHPGSPETVAKLRSTMMQASANFLQ